MGANASGESSGSGVVLPQPVNHVSISMSNQSIRDTWVIDTRMEFPPDLLSKKSTSFFKSEVRPNLELNTSNFKLSATVMLVSGSPERAIFKLATTNACAEFRMVCKAYTQYLLSSHRPLSLLVQTTSHFNSQSKLPIVLSPLGYLEVFVDQSSSNAMEERSTCRMV